MTKEMLAQYLPQDLIEFAMKFTIPEDMLQKDADLVILLLKSKSLNTVDEKQNWFNLYPVMNDEQIGKLREILTKEKEKLQEIEEKYKKKHEEITRKYEEANERRAQQQVKIKEAEAVAQQKESEDADALLDLI